MPGALVDSVLLDAPKNLKQIAVIMSPHELSALWFNQGSKSQISVVEQAIETAALMLGSQKSPGYCLEMICADSLAG